MLREGIFIVKVPIANVGKNGVILASHVVSKLLKQMANIKTYGNYGYFIAVTEVISIRQGESTLDSQVIIFPVEIRCRTLLPVAGEVMIGVVRFVNHFGAMMTCGPMNLIYLSSSKMPGFLFQEEDNDKRFYLREDMSRIEPGVVVCFSVLDCRFQIQKREYHVLATIDGDGLGPVSHNGIDYLDV